MHPWGAEQFCRRDAGATKAPNPRVSIPAGALMSLKSELKEKTFGVCSIIAAAQGVVQLLRQVDYPQPEL
jgi:hypothetical protein